MEENQQIRHKNIRLKDYNYSQTGYYFVTICTKDREELLCKIIENNNPIGSLNIQNELTDIGKIIDMYINNIGTLYNNIRLDYYIIMPNHIHLIVIISNSSTKTLPDIIRSFKTISTKVIGFPIWQKNYFEHVIRCEQELDEIRNYIANNPLKWYEDEYYTNTSKNFIKK